MTKLESKLPEFYNGLEEITSELLENPKEYQVAIILFKTSKIVTDTDTNTNEAVIKIKRIEPLFREDRETVEEIYHRVYEARVGIQSLPFDEERNAKDNGTSALELEVAVTPKPHKRAPSVVTEVKFGATNE